MSVSQYKFFSYFIIAVVLTLGLSISWQSLLAAWTAPLANPPACSVGNPGCHEPINSGPTLQTINGALWLANQNYPTSLYGLIVEKGKVGIGIVSPEFQLDVRGGQINAAGGLCMNGDCKTSWSEIVSAGGGISALTAGTGISITGSGNSRTITATGGSGTVTSVTAGTGLSGGTITTAGTLSLNLANANTWTGSQTFSGLQTSQVNLSGNVIKAQGGATEIAVNYAGTAKGFTVYDNTTPLFRVDSAGNVSIAQNLTVSGTTDGVDFSVNAPNWTTAYNERRQWDGGSTNLVAATGRASLGLNALASASLSCSANQIPKYINSVWTCANDSGGSGTVTSITAGTGLSGGTITTSGTISLNLANANTWTGAQTFSGQVNAAGGLCLGGDCRDSWLGSYSLGDILLISSDVEKNMCLYYNDWSWHKAKEIKIAKAGTLRIKYDLHYSGGATNTRANIRRNGVVVGTERSNNSTSYITYTEDISGWSAGDSVELWTVGAGGACAYVQNFRIYTSETNFINEVMLE